MTHLSTLRLHQLRLGELDAHERAPLEEHLRSCALCAVRLAHQDAERAAFVRAPIPEALLPKPTLWERLGAWKAAFFLVPALAGALLAVRFPPEEADEVRTKGATPILEAWVQAGDSARPVYVGEHVRAGTRVQLKYNAGHHRFVTLAGRDGTGTVEVYGTVPATGPGLAPAPFALTLDDSAGEQAFFAVLTDTKPAPDDVVHALASEPVRMERGEIASVVLAKE